MIINLETEKIIPIILSNSYMSSFFNINHKTFNDKLHMFVLNLLFIIILYFIFFIFKKFEV